MNPTIFLMVQPQTDQPTVPRSKEKGSGFENRLSSRIGCFSLPALRKRDYEVG